MRQELVVYSPTSEKGVDYSLRLSPQNGWGVISWENIKIGVNLDELKLMIDTLNEFKKEGRNDNQQELKFEASKPEEVPELQVEYEVDGVI